MLTFENLTTGEMLTLGKVGSEYVLAHQDFGTVRGSSNTTPYINLIGSHVDSTGLEERDIAFVGFVKTSNTLLLKERKAALKKFFNPMDFIKVYNGDYMMVFKPSQTVKDSTNAKENLPTYYRFSITGIAYDPLWKLKTNRVLRKTEITARPLFPLIIPADTGIAFGYIPAASVENVPNFGDVDVGFIVRVTAAEGNVTNPKIINNNTGDFIELALEMMQGDIVEISTENGNKYAKIIRDNTETDIFKYVTAASTMSMRLQVGINDLSITAAGNSSNLTSALSYSPQWLEVVV